MKAPARGFAATVPGLAVLLLALHLVAATQTQVAAPGPVRFRGRLRLRSRGGGRGHAPPGRAGARERLLARARRHSAASGTPMGGGVSMSRVVQAVVEKMQFDAAVKQLRGKLPGEVQALLRMTSRARSRTDFSEDSLSRAREILNSMIESAWSEMDTMIAEFKEFEERNRGTFDHVQLDIAELSSQIADSERRRVEASEEQVTYDRARAELVDETATKTREHKARRAEMRQKLTRKRDDEAALEYVQSLTKCAATSLLQLEAGHAEGSRPGVRICRRRGGLRLALADPRAQAKLDRIMTPGARLALHRALSESLELLQVSGNGSAAARGVALIQTGDSDATTTLVQAGDSDATTTLVQAGDGAAATTLVQAGDSATTTLGPAPTYDIAAEPVEEGVMHPHGQWKKCVHGGASCGPLHDRITLQWGKHKDELDELQERMHLHDEAFEKLTANTNDQLIVMNDAKTVSMEKMAEAVSELSIDNHEMGQKEEQRRMIEKEYSVKKSEMQNRISDLLFTSICAIYRVRNGLMTHSTVSPPEQIVDCDMSDWTSGECSMQCDDRCSNGDQSKCGGSVHLHRSVIVQPNTYGVKCPALNATRRCNQVKCPVDCVVSEWSGWSSCTKDCEGGLQTQTRSILTKPRHGGRQCDTVQEERPCNTDSCDRDCRLSGWSEWSPCSVACGGGLSERKRSVLAPIKGEGKCPRKDAPARLEEADCNKHDCVGDEVCIARQDLIIAVDGSGSVTEEGFAAIKEFAANLTGRYEAQYYGRESVRVGVVLFGQGEVLTDGSIRPAENIQALTHDISAVRTQILGLTWQRGFTNLAQAYAAASVMLSEGGRPDAQSAVLTISDGKVPFQHMTGKTVKDLKASNVMMYMAPIVEFDGQELDLFRRWASQPWPTNLVRIPGIAALADNPGLFAGEVLTKFCPDSLSPSQLALAEDQKLLMLIYRGGFPSNSCGQWYDLGYVDTEGACGELARANGQMAFSYGNSFAKGHCYAEAIAVDDTTWTYYQTHRTDPPCTGGTWIRNPYYDVHILKPVT